MNFTNLTVSHEEILTTTYEYEFTPLKTSKIKYDDIDVNDLSFMKGDEEVDIDQKVYDDYEVYYQGNLIGHLSCVSEDSHSTETGSEIEF